MTYSSKQIKKISEDNNVSYGEMSRRAGLSESVVSRITNPNILSIPTPNTVDKLAAVFEISEYAQKRMKEEYCSNKKRAAKAQAKTRKENKKHRLEMKLLGSSRCISHLSWSSMGAALCA